MKNKIRNDNAAAPVASGMFVATELRDFDGSRGHQAVLARAIGWRPESSRDMPYMAPGMYYVVIDLGRWSNAWAVGRQWAIEWSDALDLPYLES